MPVYTAKIISSALIINASSQEEAEELYDKYFDDELSDEECERVEFDDNYVDHEWEVWDETQAV
jgi:hypothetical protein